VVGGLLGNQIGKGTGNTVATVGGAVAGGVVGNEIQKKMSSKKVWVTSVKMKDGSIKTFEQEAKPGWAAGNVVQVNGTTLTKQ
jgi:outer membrane lipoprotein SlyB